MNKRQRQLALKKQRNFELEEQHEIQSKRKRQLYLKMRKKNKTRRKTISSVVFLMFVIVAFLLIFYDNAHKASIPPVRSSNTAPVSSKVPIDNTIPYPTISTPIKIVLDAGHGGFDVGYESTSGLAHEYIINLIITNKIGAELLKYGFTPIYTRVNDDAIADTKESDMQKRVDITNVSNAALFISIHSNSFPSSPSVRGPEVYYYGSLSQRSSVSKTFAESLQVDLNTATDGTRSSRPENLMVIRESNIPAILIECGYMSNPQEEVLLNTESYQDLLARTIARNIYEQFAQ